jgi:hypothetical protein
MIPYTFVTTLGYLCLAIAATGVSSLYVAIPSTMGLTFLFVVCMKKDYQFVTKEMGTDIYPKGFDTTLSEIITTGDEGT